MYSKKATIFSIFIVLMGIFSNLASSVVVNAATDYSNQFITNAELQDENGNPQDHFGLHATMIAHYEFVIPDDVSIHSGDSMTITLPPELTISGSLGFEVRDDAGNVVGHATVDKSTGTVSIVFTDYYENHPNEKKGSFDIFTQWDKSEITIGDEIDIDLGTGGSTITIDDDDLISPDEKLAKWGWVDDNDPTLIHWVVRVNYEGKEIKNAVYTDFIGSNQILVSGTIEAKLGTYDASDNFIWDSDLDPSHIVEGADGRSFTVAFGDLNKSSFINYDTRATDGGISNQYENKGKLTGSNIDEITVDVYTPETGGNGEGSGVNQSVILIKKDKQSSQVLQGAVFKLIDKSGMTIKDNLTTDSNGKIKVDGLAKGLYSFIEVKAPKGYTLDPTPQPFEIVANQQEAVQIEMVNELYKGAVVLTKMDSKTEIELRGAVFNLEDSKGNVVKSDLTTNEFGQIVVEGLDVGNYQFVEMEAPTGYILDQTPIIFAIEEGQTSAIQVSMSNELVKGGAVLTKKDSKTGKELQGAVFDIQNTVGNVIKSNLVTDEWGKIIVDGLEPGEYQFVETKAPIGYILDQSPVSFTIEKNQSSLIQVSMTNKLLDGKKTQQNSESERKLPKAGEKDSLVIVLVGVVLSLLVLIFYFYRMKSRQV